MVGTWTPTPVLHQASQTATTTSTPSLAKPELGADPGQDSGSESQPSPTHSANAGIALASHGSVLGMALTGLLATVLAF